MKKKLIDSISENTAVICILSCAVLLFPLILLAGILWEVFNFLHRTIFK